MAEYITQSDENETYRRLIESNATAREFRDIGFSLNDLKIGGYTPKQFIDAGVSVMYLTKSRNDYGAEFSVEELMADNVGPRQLKEKGVPAEEFHRACQTNQGGRL